MTTSNHPAFKFSRTVRIEALQVDIQEYHHKLTGAIHYHIEADNPENVFLVALRTVPMDHKGVAHILEHTVLCGSRKYPVRDPFFMMIRRSLNTFMNAFTSNDWTAYPFASQNRKDFNNLLEVYLDAVFFSRLDELDFLQEGHRLEFKETANTDSDLAFKGVVFNEMKGAMSSISSTLWQTLCKYLFPATTYHYNSGGEPEYITDLSYQELLDFYKAHYHPSNAIFMTYGDIPASEHHAFFEEHALKEFTARDETISVGKEKRYLAPVKAEEYYSFDSNDPEDKQTHIVLGWLLGQNTSLKDVLTANLACYVLLENSASPLQHFLETTNLGTSPSPMCGLEDSYHEIVFCCGIAGSEAIHADDFEQQVLSIIQDIVENGFPQERLEAILQQLELSQREIGGDGFPYGLQLIMTALPSVTHRGDPIELLDLDPILAELRESIKDPDFIKNLLKDFFLDNQHRVRLVMKPDKKLGEKKLQAESRKLAEIREQLSEQDKETIVSKTEALEKRQMQKDDVDILPKVGIEDIPEELSIATSSKIELDNILLHRYDQGTNGLAYQQLVLPVPDMDDELFCLLPLYAQCLTEVGLGEATFTDIQNRQSNCVGSISAYNSFRGSVDDEQIVPGFMILSAKALTRKHIDMNELLKETLESAHFNETARIRDIVSQNRTRKENSISGNGHMLAMAAACQDMSPLARWNEKWGGMSGIKRLRELDNSIDNPDELNKLCERLTTIHEIFKASTLQIVSIAEPEEQTAIIQHLKNSWEKPDTNEKRMQFTPSKGNTRVGWIANTQINFCSKCYKTVPANHPDAPALTVLGGFLRNGFLHTAIREKGGAYGGGASQDTNIASFKFYSYRDPRISGTLEDFDKTIDWMLEADHDHTQLEEAILGVISSLDKPASPAGEAKHAFQCELFGRTPEQRKAFRHHVLGVSLEDLKRVTRDYLKDADASIGIVTSEANTAELESLGLEKAYL